MNTQTQVAEYQPTSNSQTVQPFEVMMDDQALDRLWRVAQIMADSKVTIPKDLQGKTGDCFAVVMQAAQWGMNPFSVAQKTHFVNGTIGYEAQLVNAVITTRAPVKGRLNFEWFGDWSKVKGKEYVGHDCGVKVSATLKGEDEPRVLELTMGQVGKVRNSPNWESDPRQQIAYLGVKRWARLYCPDVILGVYSADELQDAAPEVDVTPAEPVKPHAGSSALKDRLKGRKAQVIEAEVVEAAPAFDYEGCKAAMATVDNAADLNLLINSVPKDLGEPELSNLRAAAKAAKDRIKKAAQPEAQPEPESEPAEAQVSPAESLASRMATADRETLDLMATEIEMFDADDQKLLNAAYGERLSQLIN